MLVFQLNLWVCRILFYWRYSTTQRGYFICEFCGKLLPLTRRWLFVAVLPSYHWEVKPSSACKHGYLEFMPGWLPYRSSEEIPGLRGFCTCLDIENMGLRRTDSTYGELQKTSSRHMELLLINWRKWKFQKIWLQKSYRG